MLRVEDGLVSWRATKMFSCSFVVGRSEKLSSSDEE